VIVRRLFVHGCVQSLYLVGWWWCNSAPAAVGGGVCVDDSSASWCRPPPVFPDLLAAFAGSLGLSPAMRNLTAALLDSSGGAAAATPCRRLVDCCPADPAAAAAASPRHGPCSVDRLPPLPPCRARGSRDQHASGFF